MCTLQQCLPFSNVLNSETDFSVLNDEADGSIISFVQKSFLELAQFPVNVFQTLSEL